MPRIDLPELMDQPWLPPWLRDGLTDGLRGAERALPVFRPIVPLIGGLTGPAAGRVVDLGSGAGGPMPVLWPALREAGVGELVLSDLFPHAGSMGRWPHGPMRYWPDAVNAAAVPADLSGVRTLINVLHHLPPADVQAALTSAAEQRQPFFAVEIVGRHPASLVATCSVAALVWLGGPLLGRRRWGYLALTWLLPILPLMLVWDGFASCMRAYGDEELRRMTERAERPGYQWTVGRTPTGIPWVPLRWVRGEPAPL